MEILKDKYTITELSERLNISDHTLRYYEKEFCLSVPKDERGRRYYPVEIANILYQIKTMRDEGLEIKAIKKILKNQEVIKDSPEIGLEGEGVSQDLVAANQEKITNLTEFFEEFKNQFTLKISEEIAAANERLSRDIKKNSIEMETSFENTIKRLESKMEKHFNDVDYSLNKWREKNNKKGAIRKFVSNVLGLGQN